MSFFTQHKGILIGVVLVIVGFVVYSYFFTGGSQQPLTVQTPSANVAVDNDLIALLSTLKSIKLDANIFSDPAFQSLQDFSQALVSEPVGRTNPFAPLGNVTPQAPTAPKK